MTEVANVIRQRGQLSLGPKVRRCPGILTPGQTGVFLGILGMLFLMPIAVLVLYAVASSWQFPQLLPQGFSPRGIEFVGRQASAIARSLLNSALYSLAVVVCSFVLSVLPARALAWYPLPLKGFLEALFLSPALLPVMTFSMGAHVLLLRMRLADTWFGVVVILTVFAYPYMLRALSAGYQRISADYAVTARNLGAGYWTTLLRVELPLLLPAFGAGASVVFLVAFSEYFLVFLVGGGAVISYTGYLVPFLKSSDLQIASILTLLFLVVPLLLFYVLEKWMQTIFTKRGLVHGSDNT